MKFQSLFFWNSRPDAEGGDPPNQQGEFQSLFFWNSRPDHISHSRQRGAHRVSILVFLELAPGLEFRLAVIARRPLFQSLFFWNSRPDNGLRSLSGGSSGVSILVFLELAPGRWTNSGGAESLRTFQSLFFWNSRPDSSDGVPYRPERPVSILVFLELAPGHAHIRICDSLRMSFNPCFSGTRARTRLIHPQRPHNLVSILVFLELAPGPGGAGPGDVAAIVSILVFLELAPGPIKNVLVVCPASRFNPCFSGTRARTVHVEPERDLVLLFQSLFFWNSRPDQAAASLPSSFIRVSILVFLELAPGP